MSRPLVIAIDGPSGAGKGTVARAVASRLGYRHVDSGAMYRAVGWKALRDGVPLDDEAAVARLAEASVIHVGPDCVTIDGDDITRAVRTPEIDRAAASVARLPKVRSVLVARQREARRRQDLSRRVRRRARPAARRGSRSLGRTHGGCRCGDAPHRARSARFNAHHFSALCRA
jgi:cytidylate kinase